LLGLNLSLDSEIKRSDNTVPAAEHHTNDVEPSEGAFSAKDIQQYLRALGVRKSVSSVQGASGSRNKHFEISDAISVLNSFNFKTSFGKTKAKKWEHTWLPILVFLNDGSAQVIISFEYGVSVKVLRNKRRSPVEEIAWSDFEKSFSGYSLLAKKMSPEEVKQTTGHWFFSAFRSSRWLYFQVLLAALISNFLALTTSIFTMTVYDRIIPNSAIESLYALSVGVLFALGCDFIIKMLRARFIDVASKRADLIVSRKLFDRILSFDSNERKQSTGALAGIVKEFETLREFFTSSTLVIIVDLPFVFFFVYVISLIAGPLGYIPLFCVPLVVIAGLIVQPFLARTVRAGMRSGHNKQSVLVETLNGLETVKSSGAGPLMKSRYQEALSAQSDTSGRAKGLSQFIVNFAASVQQYAQIAIIFYGVFLIRDGEISQGALIAAVILGGRAMAPLGQLANVLSRANNALSAYRSLSKLFRDGGSYQLGKNSISRGLLDGEIEFKDVSFQYDELSEKVIDSMNFKIPKGQKVAIVGKMGSGKSTIAKLLSHSISPTNGSVLLDGVDIRQLDSADLQRNVGIMPQEPWLFSGTVRENLQVGFTEYSDDQILSIAKIGGVDEFVSQLPEGYDTILLEKGAGLSGGQKQAISLSRALLHSPGIVVLDEPTSSMDQNSEKIVVERLYEYCKEKTLVIITHRNALLAICDRIIVMENGKIISDNTPEELGVKKLAI
jgi:ATP-binding cassette subfamily C protein LapB